MGRRVAAFDFDGTVTRRDTLVPFLRRLHGPGRFTAAGLASLPALARGREAFKAALLHRLLRGMPAEELARRARAYGEELPPQFRPEAVERIRWHQEQGHQVVLVSASLRAYLDPVVEHLGLDGVCAVELEVDGAGRLTGHMTGPNCRGPEKVVRLTAWLGDEAPERLWAYGNSSGDRELLAAAHEPTWIGRRR
ncbi:MAG TPA: HAD-IB family hydrolase [Acidimicrobiales bacterium]|nr:HAD-IB family hydrolase [Acidimicrobiales bacterium]